MTTLEQIEQKILNLLKTGCWTLGAQDEKVLTIICSLKQGRRKKILHIACSLLDDSCVAGITDQHGHMSTMPIRNVHVIQTAFALHASLVAEKEEAEVRMIEEQRAKEEQAFLNELS